MRFLEFLVEYNEQRVINDFGKKFVAKMAADPSVYISTTDSDEKIIAKHLRWLKLIDPTENNEYIHWMVGNYVRGSIQRWEDFGRVGGSLDMYTQLKLSKKIPNELRDINRLNFDQLQDVVEKYYKKEDFANKDEEKNFFKNKEATLVYNDDEIKIVIPHTQEASMYFGVNTRWCTAAREDNYFERYNKVGPLYIILIKKDNLRYQFHFESEQYMNEKDIGVDPRTIANTYPKLWDIFDPICREINNLSLIKKPTDQERIDAIIKKQSQTRYVTDKFLLTNATTIFDKLAPTVTAFSTIRAFLRIYYDRKIELPTDIQIQVVKSLLDNVLLLYKPCQKAVIIAFNKSARFFPWLDHPTVKQAISALRRDDKFHSRAKEILNHPVFANNDEVKKLVIKAAPKLIYLVPNITEELKEFALRLDPFVADNYSNLSEELQIIAFTGILNHYARVYNNRPNLVIPAMKSILDTGNIVQNPKPILYKILKKWLVDMLNKDDDIKNSEPKLYNILKKWILDLDSVKPNY